MSSFCFRTAQLNANRCQDVLRTNGQTHGVVKNTCVKSIALDISVSVTVLSLSAQWIRDSKNAVCGNASSLSHRRHCTPDSV